MAVEPAGIRAGDFGRWRERRSRANWRGCQIDIRSASSTVGSSAGVIANPFDLIDSNDWRPSPDFANEAEISFAKEFGFAERLATH
jgi:hypothetical protein